VENGVVDNEGLGLAKSGESLQYGKGARLTAPSEVAMQEVIRLAVHNADLYPGDIDVCECHSHGAFIQDTVEAAIEGKALRMQSKGVTSILEVTTLPSPRLACLREYGWAA